MGVQIIKAAYSVLGGFKTFRMYTNQIPTNLLSLSDVSYLEIGQHVVGRTRD